MTDKRLDTLLRRGGRAEERTDGNAPPLSTKAGQAAVDAVRDEVAAEPNLPLLMVSFDLKSGESKGFSYSYLQSAEFDPARGITLRFATQRVLLKGRNLRPLYLLLLDQSVAAVAESRETFHPSDREDATIVTAITFEELGM